MIFTSFSTRHTEDMPNALNSRSGRSAWRKRGGFAADDPTTTFTLSEQWRRGGMALPVHPWSKPPAGIVAR